MNETQNCWSDEVPHVLFTDAGGRRALNILKVLVLFIAMFSASGCTHYAMDSAVASWQSQQLTSVTAAWGDPTEELYFEGKRMYLWYTFDGKLAPRDSRKPASLSDSHYCVRLLEADRSGKIVHGAWEGNDCPGVFSGWAR